MQPDSPSALHPDEGCPRRRKFPASLQSEINKRGTIDVLRIGVKHGRHELDLFWGTPAAENLKARRRFEQNRTSQDDAQRSLDIGFFTNGLSVFTYELKRHLTKQRVRDTIWLYS